MLRRIVVALFILAGLMLLSRVALADGMMMPVRPEVPRFSVSYHKVNTVIDHQVATTDIDQAFHNHAKQQVEGTYIFPLGEGMTISKFSMYAGNEALPHRILDKDEARSIYNGIVAARKDPALLEWLGTRMIKASVFPIEPESDKRIRIAYQEVLKAQGGVFKYVYPLKTEKVSSEPLKECSINVTIRSAQPIRSVYSPTHPIKVEREGEYIAHVSYAEKNVLPDQDFILYYTVSEQNLGVDLLTYRDPEKGDGFFLLMAAPKAEISADEVQPKDVVFVLDKSGSMANDNKIEQAKGALKFCLNSLDRRDRFTVIAFNEDARWWQKSIYPATRENVKTAEEFVSQFKAEGGTNIDYALKTALDALKAGVSDGGARPAVIIFLTDGQPTVGETNVDSILANINKANNIKARIFDFGVGNDYNVHFLDKLASQHNGFAENVLPKEDIEVKVSSFYSKVATPLLMNLALEWGTADTYDIMPKELPDLFKGSQVLIAGRYKIGKENVKTTLTLTGEINGKKQVFKYPVDFPTSSFDDENIPRLWATRKIGFLEDQMRLNGAKDELMKELIRLSKEYGILTQYTSFLVDMDVNPPTHNGIGGALGPSGGLRAGIDAKDDALLFKPEEAQVAAGNKRLEDLRDYTVGGSSVAQSVNSKVGYSSVQAAKPGGNVIMNEAGRNVQLSQFRNISQRSFVQAGPQWVDVNYRNTQKIIKVKAYSAAYFQLANSNARLAQYLSMGNDVIVGLKENAIQVSTDGISDEMKAADFEKIKKEIDTELPALSAANDAGVPVAMAQPAKNAGGAPFWPWAVLFAPALPVMALLRKASKGK